MAEAVAFDLTQPGERGSEQGSEQDPSYRQVGLGADPGGRDHHVSGEAHRRLVDEPGIGPVQDPACLVG